MPAEEYKAKRKRLGLTQPALGEAVGLHWNVIARRERGELPIPREAALAIDFLVKSNAQRKRIQAKRKRTQRIFRGETVGRPAGL
jgi:predicted transcriptional regulator